MNTDRSVQKNKPRPSLDDETFDHHICFGLPAAALVKLRAQRHELLAIETNGTQQSRLYRQIKWLNGLIREKNLFTQARRLRGAPENKEERRALFNSAFVLIAHAELLKPQYAQFCRLAEDYVDDQAKKAAT